MSAGRRPRRETVLLAATVLLGTALLLWGADWAARWGAESLLARSIQSATGVDQRPVVTVHGTFFLPQVVRGRYGDVEITVDDLTAGPLQIQRVHARLTGVRLSFHDVLTRQAGPVVVEKSREDATLDYDDLNRYLKATGRPIRIAAGPDGQAKLTGTVTVLGHPVSASALARFAPKDGDLAVTPTQLDTDTPLDRASELLLGQRFGFVVPLDPLPFGQQLTSIRPGKKGVAVTARGSVVVVQP